MMFREMRKLSLTSRDTMRIPAEFRIMSPFLPMNISISHLLVTNFNRTDYVLQLRTVYVLLTRKNILLDEEIFIVIIRNNKIVSCKAF